MQVHEVEKWSSSNCTQKLLNVKYLMRIDKVTDVNDTELRYIPDNLFSMVTMCTVPSQSSDT